MIYRVEFSQVAEKQLSKLGKELQERIIHSLERIQMRPFHFVEKIVGSGYYRLRVGDYRVILDIKQDKLIIFAVEIGHRRNIYG